MHHPYYDCSPDLAYALLWKYNGKFYPYAQYEQHYHRPDLVQQMLAQ